MRAARDHHAGGHWLDLHSGKAIRSVIVNGVSHDVPGGYLSYADIAILAGKLGARNLTVQYRGSNGQRGTLAHDQSVLALDAMEIDAVFTGNA